MPQPSGFPTTAEVWLPLSRAPGLARDRRDARTLRVIGRLRDGVSMAAARADVESVIDRAARGHPETSTGLRARVVPINERYFGRATDTVWIAFITASFLIVLVSSANAANLLLARAAARAREMAIRGSLGASRMRIVRQILVESAALAALGGAVGLAISLAGVRSFLATIPANSMPYWNDFSMDARVFAALVAVAAATVLVSGFVPALQASTTDVSRVLKDGGRGAMPGRGARRLTTSFLTAQFALAVVLLAQVVVTYQSDGLNLASDTAVNTTEVLTVRVTLPSAQYRTPDQRMDFYQRLGDGLRAIPGVTTHAITEVPPLRGGPEQRLEVEGQARSAGEAAPPVTTVIVGPRYFETFGLALLKGRDFSNLDGTPGQAHVIVNQRLAELHFADQDPLGKRIHLTAANEATSATPWLTIVGVAPNIRQRNASSVGPVAYLPLCASPPTTATILTRSLIDHTTLTGLVRESARVVDPHLPLYSIMTMAQVVYEAGGTAASRMGWY